MNDWHEGDVEANGIRLHYTRTGGDKPPLVLAHGVTDDGLCWSLVAAALAPDFDVVMVDARGHGRSEATGSGYGPAIQTEDLAGVIAALELEKPAVLGHSMGAATALVLAGMHPDVPSAIILEDPPAWWTPWAGSPGAVERHAAMRARFAALKHKTQDELIADQRREQPNWAEAELEPWVNAKQRFSPHVLEVIGRDNAATVNWQEILPRITCPALLITADPELGGIVTAESAAALRTLVPHLEIAHIAGAGHNIRRDRFEQFLEVVRGFLAAHSSRPAG